MKVLVIEDDDDVRTSIQLTLAVANYNVDTASDGAEGLYKATEWVYDVIILDVMLPGKNGWEILKSIREKSIGTPILMLSALGTIDHRVKGLEEGADDYIIKPYNERELLARVAALTRRTPKVQGEVIQIGRVTIKLKESAVELDGQAVELTAYQFRILSYLARRADRIVSRADLVDAIYGDENDKMSNVIEVQIYHIRKKLGKNFLKSKRGLGYVIPTK